LGSEVPPIKRTRLLRISTPGESNLDVRLVPEAEVNLRILNVCFGDVVYQV